MPEKQTQSNELSPQATANIERLKEAGEIGEYFADLYSVAIEDTPELADILIIPGSKETDPVFRQTAGQAFHQGGVRAQANLGIPELEIDTGDGWVHYSNLMAARPVRTQRKLELLGIEPSQAKDFKSFKKIVGFTFGHELGHCKDFLERPDFDKFVEGRVSEIHSLPGPVPERSLSPWVGNVLREFLASDEGKKYMAENHDTLAAQGLKTAEEIMLAQEAAYINLPTEVYADQYAVKLLELYDDKLTGTSNDAIESALA